MLHVFSVSRRWEYARIHFEATIAYLPSLVVDAEGKIARFVAITLRVCHHLVVLMYWTLGQRLLLLSQERGIFKLRIGK